MVGLPKVVLYVIIFSWDSEFYEFIFERPRLLSVKPSPAACN